MQKQDEDTKSFMQKPFIPEAAAGSAAAALVAADPKVLKGLAIFQANSCNSCHGDGGVGTAAAGPLTGVRQKYTDPQLAALLHSPDTKMTAGGMTPVDLKQDDMEASGHIPSPASLIQGTSAFSLDARTGHLARPIPCIKRIASAVAFCNADSRPV